MQRAVRLLFLGFAVGMFGAIFLSAASARAALPTVQVAIDVETSDNRDNALGPTDTCNSTPLQVGDTIDIDVVVRGVPAFVPSPTIGQFGKNGIAGFGFNLLFDPSILQVNNVLAFDGPTILKAADHPVPVAFLNYDGYSSGQNQPPGRSGNVRVDLINLGSNFANGDGVLTRITLQAVGTGTSRLDFEDTPGDTTLPQVYFNGGDGGELYGVTKSPAALVVGGGSCANPTPGPFPTPTRVPGPLTPGPSPSVTPLLRNTITFEPNTIPVNQDSAVTLSATAESPGIANFSITVGLGDGVGYVSCSTQTAATCFFEQNKLVEFGNPADKPHIGAFTIGQLTVHPTGPAGKTALSFADVVAQDASSNSLTVTIENCIVTTFAGTPTPTPTGTLPPHETPAPTPTSSPAPCPTPAPGHPPTVAPSPAPVLKPAALPRGGGAPAPRGSTWPAGVALLGGVIVLATAFVVGRRRLG
jgi:hypothetical protein